MIFLGNFEAKQVKHFANFWKGIWIKYNRVQKYGFFFDSFEAFESKFVLRITSKRTQLWDYLSDTKILRVRIWVWRNWSSHWGSEQADFRLLSSRKKGWLSFKRHRKWDKERFLSIVQVNINKSCRWGYFNFFVLW